jgi:hypothetical protein
MSTMRTLLLDAEGLTAVSPRNHRVGRYLEVAAARGARVVVPWTVLAETLHGKGWRACEHALSRFPLVDRAPALFPPEPARFAGAHIVREAVRRKERAEARGRKPNPLAVRIARLVPSGLEDH